MHILVIDDDDRLRQLLKDFLKKNNFKVSVSPNANNAVKLLNSVSTSGPSATEKPISEKIEEISSITCDTG